MQKYVLGFAFSKDLSKVLLINKSKPEWQAGFKNGIGGKVEQGELLPFAMSREFFEETGIQSVPIQWVALGSFGSDNFKVKVYCTKELDIDKFKQMEDEKPEIVDSTFFYQEKSLPNLTVLIPACKLVLSGVEDFTLNIEY